MFSFKNIYLLIESYRLLLLSFFYNFYNFYNRSYESYEREEENINKSKYKSYKSYYCSECFNKIKNSDIYFAIDKSFCTEICRTIYIDKNSLVLV
jgi:hypothetical protein